MADGIKGLDKLMKKYGDLQGVADQGVKKAIGQGVKIAQAGAVLMCPVNDGELRQSIKTRVEIEANKVIGAVYTNKKYAPYIEFGTGPKGEADHAGISPEFSPVYSQSPWWIHESQVDAETAEKYHWFFIDTPEGRFYQTSGQAAQPFMYPGLKDNEDIISRKVKDVLSAEIRKVSK